MKYISLFAGIGGFDLALNRLGHECVYANEWDKYAAQTYEKNFSNIKHTETQNDNGGNESNVAGGDGEGRRARSNDSKNTQPISEKLQDGKGRNRTLNQDGSDGLQPRYGERPGYRIDTRDITTVPASSIPDHDLLVGGFPCQSFSIAGKRGGFNDTRGTLFFDIARILKEKHPRHFILENVKGLLSHDNGRTFKTIISTLVELGYDIQWQVLNSKNFGVPQNRERVFIVGHPRGEPRPEVFPIRAGNEPVDELYRQQVTGAITARRGQAKSDGDYVVESVGQTLQQVNKPKHSNDRVYGEDGISPTLNTMQGGRRQPKILNPLKDKTNYGWHFEQNVYDENGIVRSLKAGEGSGNKPKVAVPMRWVRTEKGKEYRRNAKKNIGRDLTPFNEGYRELVESKEDVTGTLTNALQKDALLKQNTKIRRLTPLECERLQGFPDNWTEGVSDTQRYKQIGNAVTVNVVYEVAKRL